MAKTKEQVAAEIQALLKDNGLTFKTVKKFDSFGDMDDFTLQLHVIEESQRFDFSPKGIIVWSD